jgi:ElaB/YqjD/DUF883 family membrane-anchored ribosome-binding protein
MAELYEKHKDKGRKIEPEVKFVGMLFLSAFMFNLSKSAVGSSGMGDILKNNPTLLASAESMISKKAFPAQKSPEQLKKEQEAELYKQYLAQKERVVQAQQQVQQQVQQPVQPPVQQPIPVQQTRAQSPVKQVPSFTGTNQTALGTAPFASAMKRPNIQNLFNKGKKDDIDDIHISSVKPGRVEVTETGARKSPTSSINSEDIKIKTSRKANRTLTI